MILHFVFRAHPKSITTGGNVLALLTLLIRRMARSILLSDSSHINAFCFSLLKWSCVSASIAGSVSIISRTICLSDEIPCWVGKALSPA